MSRTLAEIEADRQILNQKIWKLDQERKALDDEARALQKEIWQARVEKSNKDKAQRQDLEKRSYEAFKDVIQPGSFVRVVGARTYKWKYVDRVGEAWSWSGKAGPAIFYGQGVYVNERAMVARMADGSHCQTGVEKVREVLSRKEFEKRFGPVQGLNEQDRKQK